MNVPFPNHQKIGACSPVWTRSQRSGDFCRIGFLGCRSFDLFAQLAHSRNRPPTRTGRAWPVQAVDHYDAASIVEISYRLGRLPSVDSGTRSVQETNLRILFAAISRQTRERFSKRLTTSTGGQLTGRGGDIIIIDDPLKAEDAHSETARTKCAEWVRTTLMSRFDNPATGAVVLVMQRLHVDDLAGVLLEAGGWDHLNLSAIADKDARIPISVSRWQERKIGDLLHPARLGMPELDRLKRDLGSLAFSAQYQQSPAPADGNIVKRAWFRYYDPAQLERRSMTIVQSWDTALKGDPSSDYSVGTTWAKDDNNYHLLDLVRVRAAYPDLINTVKGSIEKHEPDIVLIEDAGSGSSLIADLDYQGIPTRPVKARTDKESRLSRVSAMIENGNVHLPKDAHWKDDFMLEVLAFPNGRHDDQVDSMSQALIWMKDDKPTGGFYVGRF